MMTAETEKRASRCCFTGHRPEKLHIPEYAVKERLGQAIDIAIDRGKTVFICGMARGVDLWAGQAVAERRKENPLVRLICATPFTGFERSWAPHWQELYHEIARNADYKVAISSSYSSACFQRRNVWMVDHSGLVIAAYNGEAGEPKTPFSMRIAAVYPFTIFLKCPLYKMVWFSISPYCGFTRAVVCFNN